MVASRIRVLVLSRKDRFPRTNMFIKCDKVNWGIWESLGASFVKNQDKLEKKMSPKFEFIKQLNSGFNIFWK